MRCSPWQWMQAKRSLESVVPVRSVQSPLRAPWPQPPLQQARPSRVALSALLRVLLQQPPFHRRGDAEDALAASFSNWVMAAEHDANVPNKKLPPPLNVFEPRATPHSTVFAVFEKRQAFPPSEAWRNSNFAPITVESSAVENSTPGPPFRVAGSKGERLPTLYPEKTLPEGEGACRAQR